MIQIDKRYPIRFSILMESRYPYIGLAKGTSVSIEDFRIGFPGIDLNMKVVKPDIDPSRLPKELEEGGKQLFKVKLEVTPTAPSLSQRLTSMFIPKKGKISFDMVMGTSRNSVYMLPAIRNKYFTNSANEYDKIYSSLDIISHFNPHDNKIVFHVANEDNPRDPSTQIKVMYDNGWVFMLLVLTRSCWRVWSIDLSLVQTSQQDTLCGRFSQMTNVQRRKWEIRKAHLNLA